MLRLFNSLTRSVDNFVPIEKGKVKMYSCGPTVYNYQHIGNFRTFLFEDILLRVLKHNGYDVKYVMNITDVGHLVSDQDEGEDKMEKSAKEMGKSVWEIAEYYTSVFKRDRALLNILPPDICTKATDYIKEQISMVQCLEAKGYTYITSDGVYFDTSRFPDYTKLARLDLEGMKEGARIEFSKEKKNISDFALWKFSPADEKRQMEWESPWGKGFPGWHIECSAMSTAVLGNHFDIHCGGIDHLPVHHTNEVAQSEACTGEKYVNYWLHGEFLDMGNEKMSKSSGNFVTLQTLIDKGFAPLEFRYFLLMAHYRKKLKFTFEALDAARSGYKNLLSKIDSLKATAEGGKNGNDNTEKHRDRFLNAVNEDMNMPVAMSVVWELLRSGDISPADKLKLAEEFDRVLGLDLVRDRPQEEAGEIPKEIESLARERHEAKKNRDFATADRLRNELKAAGYEITDTKEGYSLKKIP